MTSPAREPELTPLEQQRAVLRAGLVHVDDLSIGQSVAFQRGIFADPDPDATARRLEGEQAAREQRELERLRTTRIRVEINLTAQQWLLLVKYGHNPLLPPNGTRSSEPRVMPGSLIGRVEDRDALYPGGTRAVYEPLRSGVCELEGVEIDGHAPSDLDPFGGCMWCGKQDIDGDDDEWDS